MSDAWRPVASTKRGVAVHFDPEHLEQGTLVRPSLRAAVDVPFKFIAAIFFFFLPFQIGALFTDRPALVFGALTTIQLLQFFPVLFATLVPAFQLAFTRYIIDEEGIKVKVQILQKTEHRVQWEKVTALLHRRTLIDRVLGIERLDIIAYGERGTTLKLVGLRHAAPLRDLVARRMRETASVERLFEND